MSATVVSRREGNPANRDPEKRSRPFTSVLLVAYVAVPVIAVILRFFVYLDATLMPLVLWMDVICLGLVAPLVTIAVGMLVTKRHPFVVGHVAATEILFAVALSISVVVGWSGWPADSPDWYVRILAVVRVPLEWVVVYFFGAGALCATWLIYRTDALRADKGRDGERPSGLDELIKWPKGARVRANTIESDDFATAAEIDHPGVPVTELQNKLPAIEENGFVRGRASIIGSERGGRSRIRLVHTDPWSQWREWPGPSHPGGSFALPIRTAYYSDGPDQWYSFAKTPEGITCHKSHGDFTGSPSDAAFGRQGATRSGKSGDAANEQAEVLTRCDVIPIYVDLGKLLQNAGWCVDLFALVANTKPKAAALMDALRRLGEHRSQVFGRIAREAAMNGGGDLGREWSPEIYQRYGYAALYVFFDEGDLVLSGEDLEWIAKRGLSLGIFPSVTIPRAITGQMESDIRSSILQWKAFACGQDYDAGFALTDETMAAGADPHAFGLDRPGAHYADRIAGVPAQRYPIDARSFKSSNDDRRAKVLAARETFTPATWHPEELKILGSLVNTLSSQAAIADDLGKHPGGGTEGVDMQETLRLGEAEVDDDMEGVEVPDTADLDEDEREFGRKIDETEPIPAVPAEMNIPLPSVKPRPRNTAEGIAEFEAAIGRLFDKGVRRFGNKDLLAEMRLQVSAATISARFRQLCDERDKLVNPPPGIVVECEEGPGGVRKMGSWVMRKADS